MIEYTCESCGNTNYAPDGAQGRFVKCLRCLELCRVPRAEVPAEDLDEAVEKAHESIQPQAEATTNSVEPAGIAEDQPEPQLDSSQSPEATSLSASASGLSLDEVMASGDSLNGGEDSCAWKPPPDRLTESNPGRIANLDKPVERRSSPIAGSMKILTISPVYCHPTWFASRVARLTNETLMGLSSLGHKNTVFCPLFDHTEEMEFGEAMRDGDGKPNRRHHSVTFADGNLKVFYRDDVALGPKGMDCGKSLPPEFATHLESARLLYLPGPVTPWMMRAAKFARSRGVPYVLEPFGSLPPEMFKRGLMSLLGGNHFESLFGRAAVVVLPDRETADQVTAWNMKATAKICPPGLMSLRYKKKKQIRLIDGEYLLYLGRVEPGKGIATLINAFGLIANNYPNHRLVLAGPGANHFKPMLPLIAQNKLTDRVIVPGCVSERKRASLLKFAQIFLRPLQEHEPTLAVHEAMACRVPLLVSKGHSSNEIEEAGAGRVVEMDAGKWARAISELIDADSLRAEMGRAGREYFKKHLLFQNRIDTILDVLCQVKSARSAA